MVEMSQALELIDVHYEQVGPDMLVSGFLRAVADLTPAIPSIDEVSAIGLTVSPYEASIIFFYKTWNLMVHFLTFHCIQFKCLTKMEITIAGQVWSTITMCYGFCLVNQQWVKIRR